MCVLYLALRAHPNFPFVAALNRDESYARPTAAAAFWREHPGMLAGRDLKAGGTWSGVTRDGRFGAVTSYRDPAAFRADAASRGSLVRDFLRGEEVAREYLERIRRERARFNPFNLILGSMRTGEFYYYGSHTDTLERLPPGRHALSNASLNTPWPKVRRGGEAFERALAATSSWDSGGFLNFLQDATPADVSELPSTGVSAEWELGLSPIFIRTPGYGTLSSTVIALDTKDRVHFTELTHVPTPSRFAVDFSLTADTSSNG